MIGALIGLGEDGEEGAEAGAIQGGEAAANGFNPLGNVEDYRMAPDDFVAGDQVTVLAIGTTEVTDQGQQRADLTAFVAEMDAADVLVPAPGTGSLNGLEDVLRSIGRDARLGDGPHPACGPAFRFPPRVLHMADHP